MYGVGDMADKLNLPILIAIATIVASCAADTENRKSSLSVSRNPSASVNKSVARAAAQRKRAVKKISARSAKRKRSKSAKAKPDLPRRDLLGPDLSDKSIRQFLVLHSLATYKGSCPCPEYTDSAGQQCGEQSAYSNSGGASPLCYPSDVTAKMIEDFRRQL